jgi:hypothetical protein
MDFIFDEKKLKSTVDCCIDQISEKTVGPVYCCGADPWQDFKIKKKKDEDGFFFCWIC